MRSLSFRGFSGFSQEEEDRQGRGKKAQEALVSTRKGGRKSTPHNMVHLETSVGLRSDPPHQPVTWEVFPLKGCSLCGEAVPL